MYEQTTDYWVDVDTSGTEFSFYIGVSLDFSNITIRPTFVWIQGDDEAATSIQVSLGYKFNLL